MYNACVWMRVLGGGLGACASGSILYNRLGEDKELNVPAIHKFTVTEETKSKSSIPLYSLPQSSSFSSLSTSSLLPVAASNSNNTVLNVLACDSNNQLNHSNNYTKEDNSQVVDESGGQMDVDKLIQQVESSCVNNCPMVFGPVPVGGEGNIYDYSTTQFNPANFDLYSAPIDVLSSEHEDVISRTDNSLLTLPEEDYRLYLSEVGNNPVEKAIDNCRCIVRRHLTKTGAVGMVVSVSVNGKNVFAHGFGFADLENSLVMGTSAIMRIASISKPITSCALAKLVEEGKINLDANVKDYVPDWPDKEVDGELVNITVRQLCSHLAGIRHYSKKGEKDEDNEFDLKEYHLNKKFKQTKDALGLFKDDELFHKPGSEFLYSTHGYTLLAAVIENVTGVPFDKYMKKQFKELKLNNTFLDEHEQIVYNRSKYYIRDEHHLVKNAPMVDNSYKWAGGGFLSNVHDLNRFGNIMLYSYQKKDETCEHTSNNSKPVNNNKIAPTTVKDSPNEKSTLDNSNEEKTEKVDPNVKSKADALKDKGMANNKKTETNVVTKTVSIQTEESNHHPENNADNATYEYNVNDEVVKTNDTEGLHQIESVATEKVEFSQQQSTRLNLKTNDKRFLPGYLKSATMAEMWTPAPNTNITWGGNEMGYGLGWAVRPLKKKYGFCAYDKFYVAHTGGAIGASSVLLIAPKPVTKDNQNSLPRGVVVSILCNTQNVSLIKLAEEIAEYFERMSLEEPAKGVKVIQC